MTWAEFVDAVEVHLTVYTRVATLQAWIAQLIKAGAVDVQQAVPYYQTGHEDWLAVDDLDELDFVHVGDAPAGEITNMKISLSDSSSDEFVTLEWVAWANVPAMKAGAVDDTPRFAVSPTGRTFILCPHLQDGEALVIEWNGVKYDFSDNDETPFDEPMAHAVAEYVMARLVRRVDHDLNEANSYNASFILLKRKLLSETRSYARPPKTAAITLSTTEEDS